MAHQTRVKFALALDKKRHELLTTTGELIIATHVASGDPVDWEYLRKLLADAEHQLSLMKEMVERGSREDV